MEHDQIAGRLRLALEREAARHELSPGAWPQIEGIEHADDAEGAVAEAIRMARLAAARHGRKKR